MYADEEILRGSDTMVVNSVTDSLLPGRLSFLSVKQVGNQSAELFSHSHTGFLLPVLLVLTDNNIATRSSTSIFRECFRHLGC